MINRDQPYAFLVHPKYPMAFNKKVFKEDTVVTQTGIGIRNIWTFVGAEPIGAQKDLIINSSEALNACNPLYIGGAVDSWITDLIWDRLMCMAPTASRSPGWPRSVDWKDDTTIAIKLRAGIKWHDGKPVTIDDVIFSFTAPAGDKAPMYKPFVTEIASMEKTGEIGLTHEAQDGERCVLHRLAQQDQPDPQACLGARAEGPRGQARERRADQGDQPHRLGPVQDRALAAQRGGRARGLPRPLQGAEDRAVARRHPRPRRGLPPAVPGVVDVGLPMALFVWASRTLVRLPVSVALLVGAFTVGAVMSLPLVLADKLVHAGGSWTALVGLADARAAELVAGHLDALDVGYVLPTAWVIARGALVVGGLAALAAWLGGRAHEQRAQTRLFGLVAAGCGLASFVRTRPSLPLLSPRWTVLLAAPRVSLDVDAHLFACYLAYALPALACGLVVARVPDAGRARWAAGIALAWAVHVAVMLVWPAEEAWLYSTGALVPAAVAGLIAVAASLRAARRLAAGEAAAGALIAVGAAALAVALGGLAAWQAHAERMVPVTVAGVDRPLAIPAGWTREPPVAGTTFRRRGRGPTASLLVVEPAPLPPAGARALLVARLEAAARALPAFQPAPRRTGVSIPGVPTATYTFELRGAGGLAVPLVGTAAVLPIAPDRALIVAVAAAPDDWEVRRWDLVRIAAALGGYSSSGAAMR